MVILEKMKNFKVKKEKILNSKDFVVLALLSSTYFLSVINAERFPQRGQVGNKITKKQSLEGVPEQGSRACNCFVPHGRRRLIGILCLCGHQLHSLLTRSLNVLKSTTAATCGGSFSGASKPILQANIDFTQQFSKSTRHFWKYFVVFPSFLLAGAKTLRRLDPRALGAAGARSRGRYEPRALRAEDATEPSKANIHVTEQFSKSTRLCARVEIPCGFSTLFFSGVGELLAMFQMRTMKR